MARMDSIGRPRGSGTLAAGLALALLAPGCGGDASPSPPSSASTRGVILVCIDTLRGDRVGFGGHTRPTTPNLDTLADRSAVFEQAYSTYPKTPPAVASLFTGLQPTAHRMSVRPFRLSLDLLTAAEIFQQAGWQTSAVMTNPHLSPGHGYEQGFDSYVYISGAEPWSEPDLPPVEPRGPTIELRRAEGLSAYARGDSVNDAARSWLAEHGASPFFLYLHYMDVHYPYVAPEPWQDRFVTEPGEDRFKEGNTKPLPEGTIPDRDLAFMQARYDGQIDWVDELLSRLLRDLEELGLRDEVLLVITSDHGEEFLEHAAFGHGHSVYRELTHVPLLIHGPGVVPGRHSRPVSLVDVLPTLGEWAGLSVGEVQGSSLARALRGDDPVRTPGDPVLAEFRGPCGTVPLAQPRVAVATPDWYLVHHFECGMDELFRWVEDPRLERDLTEDHPGIVRELTEWASSRLSESDRRASGIRIEPGDYDERTLERLRALGYMR